MYVKQTKFWQLIAIIEFLDENRAWENIEQIVEFNYADREWSVCCTWNCKEHLMRILDTYKTINMHKWIEEERESLGIITVVIYSKI